MAPGVKSMIRQLLPPIISYMASGGALIAASIAQLITFAVIARYLGAEQFALFVTVSATTNVGMQICGLGANESLLRRVARDHAMFPVMIGHSMILTVATGFVLVAVGLLVLPMAVPALATPDGFVALLLLLVANVVMLRFFSITTAGFMAFNNFRVANGIEVLAAAARTVAALFACFVFNIHTMVAWAGWLFAAHLLVSIVCVLALLRLGRPRYRLVVDEIRIGALLASQFIFKALRQNSDLVAVGMVAGPETVASYGLARRILDSSILSVDALNRIVYPGSAVVLAGGFHRAVDRVKLIMAAAIGISLVTALAVFVLAPLTPLIFGHEYVSLVGFVRAMCWLVIPFAVGAVVLEVFGAAGRQGVRAALLNTAYIVAAGAVALAILRFGIPGAFVSAYVADSATAAIACLVLARYIRNDRQRFGIPATASRGLHWPLATD